MSRRGMGQRIGIASLCQDCKAKFRGGGSRCPGCQSKLEKFATHAAECDECDDPAFDNCEEGRAILRGRPFGV